MTAQVVSNCTEEVCSGRASAASACATPAMVATDPVNRPKESCREIDKPFTAGSVPKSVHQAAWG